MQHKQLLVLAKGRAQMCGSKFLYFAFSCRNIRLNPFVLDFSDDPSPRLSAQAQAAEDILDKYRNAIKRTSPSEGALVNYDSGGENLAFIVLTDIVFPP